jgi:hypothetical protein
MTKKEKRRTRREEEKKKAYREFEEVVFCLRTQQVQCSLLDFVLFFCGFVRLVDRGDFGFDL